LLDRKYRHRFLLWSFQTTWICLVKWNYFSTEQTASIYKHVRRIMRVEYFKYWTLLLANTKLFYWLYFLTIIINCEFLKFNVSHSIVEKPYKFRTMYKCSDMWNESVDLVLGVNGANSAQPLEPRPTNPLSGEHVWSRKIAPSGNARDRTKGPSGPGRKLQTSRMNARVSPQSNPQPHQRTRAHDFENVIYAFPGDDDKRRLNFPGRNAINYLILLTMAATK